MTKINRRDAMKRGGAALVATAAMMGTAAATSDVSDEGLRDLWWRFIEAELRFSDACSAEDNASWTVRTECGATLVCPWTPLSRKGEWLTSADRSERLLRVEQVLAPTVMQQGGDGPWLVKEYQLPASDYLRSMSAAEFRDGYIVRLQPYPEATTADDAYSMAKARADKEWRSFHAKRGAVSRKHEHRALEAAVEVASDASRDIRIEIAKAPTSGPLAIAIKLAAWADWNTMPESIDPDEDRPAIIDGGGLGSIYAWAVEACGYDPIAAINEARAEARA